MKENLFTKGFEKGISWEKIAATEIKKNFGTWLYNKYTVNNYAVSRSVILKNTRRIESRWKNINFSNWKTLGRCPKPYELLKKFNQNFYQNAITLRFSEQNYKLYY